MIRNEAPLNRVCIELKKARRCKIGESRKPCTGIQKLTDVFLIRAFLFHFEHYSLLHTIVSRKFKALHLQWAHLQVTNLVIISSKKKKNKFGKTYKKKTNYRTRAVQQGCINMKLCDCTGYVA